MHYHKEEWGTFPRQKHQVACMFWQQLCHHLRLLSPKMDLEHLWKINANILCTLETTIIARRTKPSTDTFITLEILLSNSFTRYYTYLVNSNIVVSSNEDDDVQQPTEELQLPWIPLSVIYSHLFVPTIHHRTPSMGLKYCTEDGITKFALLPRIMVIHSTVIRNRDRPYHNKVCDALDDLEWVQYKSFQRGYSCHVFTDNTHKYCIAGVQPHSVKTGISSQT